MTTKLRIVLAGYEEEHIAAMPASWRMYSYAGNKCYGTTAAVGLKQGNDANRHNERLWLSPHCLDPVALADAALPLLGEP